MSRNGSGTYNLPAGNPVTTGTTISSSWANSTLNDIANALTGSIAADGQTPITANLNLNNNKIVSLAEPNNAQDATTKNYVDTLNSLALLKANNLSDVANTTTARTNISAAKSGANSDITSITGLTTALAVNQGGTGVASLSANAVVLGNGTSAVQTVAPSTNGNVLTSNGTTWVSQAPTSSVTSLNGQTGAITNTNLYSIGSYIVGRPANYTSYAPDSTIAGSSLYSMTTLAQTFNSCGALAWQRVGAGIGVTVNLINTGTWRCTSRADASGGQEGYPGLWVRIS